MLAPGCLEKQGSYVFTEWFRSPYESSALDRWNCAASAGGHSHSGTGVDARVAAPDRGHYGNGRQEPKHARREANAALDMEQTTAPQFDFDDGSQRELAAAVDRLPIEQREVLVMKIWNELTFAEIASALDISQNTAASRYRYGLTALKKNLSPTV